MITTETVSRSSAERVAERLPEAFRTARAIVENVAIALEGKREVIELTVVALAARGHVLVEDVPGVGKTTLARALARSMSVTFRRVQFTSDMMPADILGGSIYEPTTQRFQFVPGPIFTNVLVADEINRTSPRTQSALLEAMDERRVSIDGETRPLPDPFFVVATQNPDDFHGTYSLPESQLDRFIMRMSVGYPPEQVERALLQNRRIDDPTDRLVSVATAEDVLAMQRAVEQIRVDPAIVEYLHAIILATRKSKMLATGASTRGALALERAVRARALVLGRDFALPDDVKSLAPLVLAHRVRPAHGHTDSTDCARAIREVIESTPVPL